MWAASISYKMLCWFHHALLQDKERATVRDVGMMVFSMVIWMSLGHKLSHRYGFHVLCCTSVTHARTD